MPSGPAPAPHRCPASCTARGGCRGWRRTAGRWSSGPRGCCRRSVSSRNSGTRPTCSRHTRAATSRPRTGTVTCSWCPSLVADGSRSGAGWRRTDPRLVLPAVRPGAAGSSRTCRTGRRRPSAGRGRRPLDDVAGQHAQAAGVLRQRLVQAELGAQERHRVLGVESLPERAGEVCVEVAASASTRATIASSAAAAARVRRASASRRTGLWSAASHAPGPGQRRWPARRGATTSAGCGPRGPAAAGLRAGGRPARSAARRAVGESVQARDSGRYMVRVLGGVVVRVRQHDGAVDQHGWCPRNEAVARSGTSASATRGAPSAVSSTRRQRSPKSAGQRELRVLVVGVQQQQEGVVPQGSPRSPAAACWPAEEDLQAWGPGVCQSASVISRPSAVNHAVS